MAAHLKIFLLITVLSSVVYVNSFHNSFHFDDQHYIVANTYIRDLSNIPSFFTGTKFSSFEKEFAAHYRPILVTSYAVNYAIGGLKPVGYHIVNLLFHIGSAFLIFLILQAMLGRSKQQIPPNPPLVKGGWGDFFIALAAALIFAVHPFNSETVNYITARSSVMCAFFYLLAFWCWINYRQLAVSSKPLAVPAHSSLLTANYYAGSLLAFILAILTKEIAITLPVMLLIYDIYFVRKDGVGLLSPHSSSRPSSLSLQPSVFSLIKVYLPYVGLVALPYLVFRSSVLKWILGRNADLYSNLITQPKVLLKYLQLMFFPAGLTIDHIILTPSTLFDVYFILSTVALLLILFSAYLLLKRDREWRVLSFFILWYFITLLPTTLIPLNAVLQENRGYLAGIIFPVFAGIILLKLPQRISILFLVILISFYSIVTIKANSYWKNEFTLWKRAVDISPSSPRSHDNMGLAYMGMGDYDRAISEFEHTLRLNPLYFLAYYNAGVAYQLQKRFDMAIVNYEKCVKLNPDFFRVYYNLGIVYKKTGELDKAIAVYERAILIDPRHSFVYNNLGIALTEKGDLEKAESFFKQAININPGYAKAYYNLGSLYYKIKRYDLAIEAFNSAIQLEPDYKEAKDMLNRVRGRLPEGR